MSSPPPLYPLLTSSSSSPSPLTNNNEFKSRNILNLEQRIKVIQHYEQSVRLGCPCSLQSLAEKFSCSSKQIKNILRKKANIERIYHTSIPFELDKDDAQQRRRGDKIEFLGKVMYEYIQRVVYHCLPIDTMKVCWKATEVKECIAIENFIVTQAWLNNFQKVYGLPSFDLETLSNNVMIYEPKQSQLNAIDLIQYVTRKEQEQQKLNQQHQQEISKVFAAVESSGLSIDNNHYQPPSKRPMLEEQNVEVFAALESSGLSIDNNHYQPPSKRPMLEEQNESLICVDDDVNNGNACLSTTNEKLNNNEGNYPKTHNPRNITYLPDIETIDQALLHIKALEEFAMLRDNYRAIGLLTQLEIMFKREIEMN